MSVQFGRWNFDGRPADREYLAKAEGTLAPYGPDGGGTYIKDSVGILFRAFHTTKESRSEAQPHVTASGAVLTWDGRLDNRAELLRQLRDVLSVGSTDASIAAAAFEKWGTSCFAKLTGDWALSVWDPRSGSLFLAKDPIGTRHLYYSLDNEQVAWSSILDPLILLADRSFDLSEEYVAGWLSLFPASHLTPYDGIHCVPPSSVVDIRHGRQTVRKYWDFEHSKQIRYPSDDEYEEHFRAVFAEAVCRRLRSNRPILAELSGGMDSSSIVCMADALLASGAADTPRLDTVSYYDDAEPHWDERPFFSLVEKKRGRVGFHIDFGSEERLKFKYNEERFAATPGSRRYSSEAGRHFQVCLNGQGYCVVLSGTGGDEVLGGVPTPVPELEDLLAKARLGALAHRLKTWSLTKRKPWFDLLFTAVRAFLPVALTGLPQHKVPAPWLNPDFVRRNRAALRGYERRSKVFGPLPTYQENLRALDALQRQMECEALPSEPPYEKRYPFLDRDLLEFLYAIPREQLVRPSQRRSLMRRALAGLVPDEILNRKRKAYVVRSTTATISTQWASLVETGEPMVTSLLGIVEPNTVEEAINKAQRGQQVPVVTLMRTLGIECWLRSLRNRGILNQHALMCPQAVRPRGGLGVPTNDPSAKSSAS